MIKIMLPLNRVYMNIGIYILYIIYIKRCRGDIIVSVDNRPVSSVRDLLDVIGLDIGSVWKCCENFENCIALLHFMNSS